MLKRDEFVSRLTNPSRCCSPIRRAFYLYNLLILNRRSINGQCTVRSAIRSESETSPPFNDLPASAQSSSPHPRKSNRYALPWLRICPQVGVGKCAGRISVSLSACSRINRVRLTRDASPSVQAKVDQPGFRHCSG